MSWNEPDGLGEKLLYRERFIFDARLLVLVDVSLVGAQEQGHRIRYSDWRFCHVAKVIIRNI